MPKVIIADDEEFIRSYLRTFLDAIDYEVVDEVDAGDKLIGSVQKYQPDILLLDINMPNLTGIEFLEQYSHMFPKICVIILTSMPLSTLMGEPSLARANCFLNKRTPVSQISDAIQKTWKDFKEEKEL